MSMVQQIEITLTPKRRGFHLVTSEIMRQLPQLPKTGIINIFCKHTSCGLSINENADPDVRVDMETIFNRIVPENRPEYEHTLEGADDMPAHAKSTLSGVSLTIPITNGRLNMGTWQGIYFCEYRNYGGARDLVVTIMGEQHSMIDFDSIWRTQDEIRTVVNAVLGECIWNLSFNEKRMTIELELTVTLDDDAIDNLSCQFPITADYDGLGARGSKFSFYL